MPVLDVVDPQGAFDCPCDESKAERLNQHLKNEQVSRRERASQPLDFALEVKRLEGCIDDLSDLLALPAVFSQCEPIEILSICADSIMEMLSLDFVQIRVAVALDESPLQVLRAVPSHNADEITHVIQACLNEDKAGNLSQTSRNIGGHTISIFPVRVGVPGNLGLIVAGSRRRTFPEPTESLVLGVTANQLELGLQHALRPFGRGQTATQVVQGLTKQRSKLAETNEQVHLQDELLQHLPVSAWTLNPDGTPDFVNEVWLRFSGQNLDFIRSHPEAWMTAIHPEDREAAARIFWDGVRSAKSFSMETRSLRAEDGTYRWHLQQAVVVRDAQGKVLKFVGATTDIDDQKRAEEELRANELRLREMTETIPEMLWSATPEGPIDYCNSRFLNYTGCLSEQLMGYGWQNTLHPEDRSRAALAWLSSVRSGEPYKVEARTFHAVDCRYRWCLFSALPSLDPQKRILKWHGTILDIHDRKQAEGALQDNERKLVSIINTIPTTAWSTRADGYCEFLSERWLSYAGMTSEECQGWKWASVIHPDDADALYKYWTSCLATGTPVDTEARMRRFDGIYRWFIFRASPLRDDSGNIVRWYGTNIDIDDRKRAEDRVRRSEAFLEEAQHLTRIGSFSWKVDANQITWSEQLYRIYGFMPGSPLTFDLIGSRMHPEDISIMNGVSENARNAVSDFEYEYRILMPDRTVRYLHSIAHANRDRKGQLEYIGAVQDVTQRRLSEEALAKARADLAHVVRVTSLGVMTASIAHEVNQPLTGILTNASTCLRMLDAAHPNLDGARETARRTIRDANRASDVITRLRTLYSKKAPSFEPIDLNDAAREVLALLLSELQSSGVTLHQEFAESLPIVQADRIQLQQVILNLVRNASDAMRDIDDRPRRLSIRTEHSGENVSVTVQDSGTGFDPAMTDRLFESFYTTKTEGMGIGLSVSRSIIEAHGGRLWVAGNDGPGATFAFSIPSVSPYA